MRRPSRGVGRGPTSASDPSSAWQTMVTVGCVARTHGLRGQVIVNPETDFVAERFRERSVLYVRRQSETCALTVAAVRVHEGRPILTFDAIGSIEEAAWLPGSELRVMVDALHVLPAGRFYRHDLVGCQVRTIRGAGVGVVAAVEGSLDASCLVVREGRREVLIPLAAEICVQVDPAARLIVVDPPEGLLELNDVER